MIRHFVATLLLSILVSTVAAQAKNISISFFATNLSGCGAFNYCDPYVKIYCQSKLSDWHLCGKTKYLSETNFPVWPEIFIFEHLESNREQWEFKVYDSDWDTDDLLGSAKLDVETFLQATEDTSTPYELSLGEKMRLFVRRNRIDSAE